MNKRLTRMIGGVIALAAGLAGYTIVVGTPSLAKPVAARSATMPANPLILYLAPQGSVRGLITDEVMQAHGATLARDWRTAQAIASSRALDALLIDAALLDAMTPADVEWVRAQFHDGVIIVGLGIEDEVLAPILGLKTLRAPAEANVPIGPRGYRLISALVLGDPEDVRIIEQSGWIDGAIRGDTTGPDGIKGPTLSSFRKSRGNLDSEQELNLLFFMVRTGIEDTYQMRAEFQQKMNDAKEK